MVTALTLTQRGLQWVREGGALCRVRGPASAVADASSEVSRRADQYSDRESLPARRDAPRWGACDVCLDPMSPGRGGMCELCQLAWRVVRKRREAAA